MQDEVTKHTKKIYKTVKDKEHGFAEKAKEIVIEICIIVFAVTLSIWLHSWSEQRHEQQEVTEFLSGLKSDLHADMATLSENKKVITKIHANYIFMHGVKKTEKFDSATEGALQHAMFFDFVITRPNIGRYEGFKSSGKIGNIKDGELKQQILEFYQQTIPNLNYSENYVNTLQEKILYLRIEKPEKASVTNFVTTDKMKSLLEIGEYNFNGDIIRYTDALAQAKKMIAEIDKVTKE